MQFCDLFMRYSKRGKTLSGSSRNEQFAREPTRLVFNGWVDEPALLGPHDGRREFVRQEHVRHFMGETRSLSRRGMKVIDGNGSISDIFAVVRFVTPNNGCLQCAGIISGERLALELASQGSGADSDYGTGQPAPSVVAFNAIAAGHAVMLSCAYNSP
jgi:hypothetical protein